MAAEAPIGNAMITRMTRIRGVMGGVGKGMAIPLEGPATSSGHRNPPRHIPDFEKKQLYLRPDFPRSWLFPSHS